MIRNISLLVLVHMFFFLPVSILLGYHTHLPEWEETPMAESQDTTLGTLHIHVNADTCFLYLNGKYDSLIVLTEEKVIRVPAGSHQLHLFGESFPEKIIDIFLAKGQYHNIHIPETRRFRYNRNHTGTYAAHHWDANLMVQTDDETSITVSTTGDTGYGFLKARVAPGVHRIILRHTSGRMSEHFVRVNSYQLSTVKKYLGFKRRDAMMFGIVPGASQFYKRQNIRGMAFLVSSGIGVFLAHDYEKKMMLSRREYNSLINVYRHNTDEQELLAIGDRLEKLIREVHRYETRRNIFLISTVVIYIANIFDSFRVPDGGYVKRHRFNPYRDFSIEIDRDIIQANMRLNL